MWNKEPCRKQDTERCLTHDQSIWTCVEMLRKNMYRVRELYEEKIRLIKALHAVDIQQQLEGGDN